MGVDRWITLRTRDRVRSWPLVAALPALLLAACATPGGAEREADALARFEAAAGEPVRSFRAFGLRSYSVLGEGHVAVWTGARQVWLLEVDSPCSELKWTMGIGLSSSLGRVHSRFDHVIAGRDRCRITGIRPVDVEALRESEKEARRETVELHARDDAAEAGAVGQSAGGT